jgi:hypothetical protein
VASWHRASPIYPLPPLITRSRFRTGISGGRRGGRSAKYAPQPLPRGSSRHGQSAERRRSRSSSKISEPQPSAQAAEWALPKIRQDFNDKIFIDEVRNEAKPFYPKLESFVSSQPIANDPRQQNAN